MIKQLKIFMETFFNFLDFIFNFLSSENRLSLKYYYGSVLTNYIVFYILLSLYEFDDELIVTLLYIFLSGSVILNLIIIFFIKKFHKSKISQYIIKNHNLMKSAYKKKIGKIDINGIFFDIIGYYLFTFIILVLIDIFLEQKGFMIIIVLSILTFFKLLFLLSISRYSSKIESDLGSLFYIVSPFIFFDVLFSLYVWIKENPDINLNFLPIITDLINLDNSYHLIILFVAVFLPLKFYLKNPSHNHFLSNIGKSLRDRVSILFLGFYYVILFFLIISEKSYDKMIFFFVIKELIMIYIILYYRRKSFFSIKKLSQNLNKLELFEGEIIGESIILEEQKVNLFNLKKSSKYLRLKLNKEINNQSIVNLKISNFNPLLAQNKLKFFPHDKICVFGFILNNEVKLDDKNTEYLLLIPIVYTVKEDSNLNKILLE